MSLKVNLVVPTTMVTKFHMLKGRALFRTDNDIKSVYLKLRATTGLFNAVRLNDAELVSVADVRVVVPLNGHLTAEDM